MTDRALEIVIVDESGNAVSRANPISTEIVDSAGNVINPAKDLSELQLLIDDFTTTGITYLGKSVAGTAENSANWQIKAIVETGDYAKFLFADGTADFVKKWSERTTYNY